MNDRLTILQGDALTVLKTLPDESVQCCVTSPPYWGLRDYGVTGQLGLEKTPEEYVGKMVEVFREVRRVLRSEGVCFVNLGDSYCGGNTGNQSNVGQRYGKNGEGHVFRRDGAFALSIGLKPKDLVGIPWRLAFALQADGWVLRQEIIWQKPNPMPESVQDRCTKAHESIFLFAKARWSGQYPPRSLFPSDARWLALLLETEGNIAVRRYTHKRDVPQHALQLAVANSDRSILEEAQRIANCGTILTAKGTNRPMYYLQWTTKEAAALLWEMYPYLFGKKTQAAIGLMLEGRRSNSNKGKRGDIFRKEGRNFYLRDQELALREKMWMAVKSLNKHRPTDLSWLEYPNEGKWIPNRYFFDAEAIKEPSCTEGDCRFERTDNTQIFGRNGDESRKRTGNATGPNRNKRSVWTVATDPYSEAHFATFPPDLIKPCILAGTSARGCCPKCGAPWERVLEAGELVKHGTNNKPTPMKGAAKDGQFGNRAANMTRDGFVPSHQRENKTTGWRPTCDCGLSETVPCTICDPFFGSGTSGMVALELGRKCIGIELNPAYIKLAEDRCNVTPGLALA